tara:strand:- start:13 stop:873 length:861 start_codon:yes stop_codon:yes gene_type:complete
MPDISNKNGIDMGDIASINEQDVPSGGGTATATPTMTVSGGTFGAVLVTVTNHSSYTNPNYSISCEAGGVVTILDSDVDHTLDTGNDSLSAAMSFVDLNSSTGTRTLSLKAQEFGDNIQSQAATSTYNVTYVQSRYLRIRGVASDGSESNNRLAINDVNFYDAAGQTGTVYPTTNLTSNTSETGIEVSQGHVYNATYLAYKAVDSSSTSMAWLLGTNDVNNWWQIEWESGTYSTVPTIKSMRINFNAQNDAAYFKIEGSDNGNFSGEETDYGVFAIPSENTNLNFG